MSGDVGFERPEGGPDSQKSVNLFFSYSHEDRVWMKRLKPLLKGFQCDDRLQEWALSEVNTWHDEQLKFTSDFHDAIIAQLQVMDIFVPLVSFDFFSSDYIREFELPSAIERQERDGILVVPILVYDVNLRSRSAFLRSAGQGFLRVRAFEIRQDH